MLPSLLSLCIQHCLCGSAAGFLEINLKKKKKILIRNFAKENNYENGKDDLWTCDCKTCNDNKSRSAMALVAVIFQLVNNSNTKKKMHFCIATV